MLDKNILETRKRNRLKDYDYATHNWYFVTICTQNYHHWFGKIQNNKMILNHYGNTIKKIWLTLPQYYKNVTLDEWVVMPNHFHGIIILGTVLQYVHKDRQYSLSEILRGFKSFSSRTINKQVSQKKFQWQRSFYDHVIRSERSLYEIQKYIQNNPLKWAIDRYYNK